MSARRVVEDYITEDNAHMGTDVTIDFQTIIVGIPGLGSGQAKVYRLNSSGFFAYEATLQANDGVSGDQFGISVAMSGNTAVVGASLDDNARGVDAGAAYVFVRDGNGQWTQQQKLTASDGRATDFFSEHAVAIEGNTIVVGAYSNGNPLDNGSGNDDDRGVAYVFTRSGTVWTEQAKISQTNFAGGEPGAHLGIDVDLSGNTVLIGARGASAGSVVRAGAAYAYRLSCVPPSGSRAVYFAGFFLSSLTACPGQNILIESTTQNPDSAPFAGLSFQWRKNGVNIPGATSSNYAIANVSASDAGTYEVIVSNSCGSEISSPFSLAVHSFSLNPTSQNFSASGSNGIVNVTAPGSSCGWTATSNASWITITSGASGTGNGTVNYSVSANSGTTQRSGTLTVAGQTFTVTQDGAAPPPPPPPTVQLSQSSYGVSEGALFTAINVTRTGDASAAATVKYQTSDTTDVNFRCDPSTAGQVTGVASRKCDYHIASGRLRFNAGETTKQIILSIIDDVYVEGAESFTLTLSSATGLSVGANSSATITITDNDVAGQSNPITGTRFFVRQLYVDLLSREPDAGGWDGWIHRIDFCGQPGEPPPPCDRVTVGGEGFLSSGEFFERQFFVLRLYHTGLGRILVYDEVGDLAYVSGFLTDQQLELNKQDLVAEMMARSEFASRYNGLASASFVNTLLQTAGVTVPQSVQDGWVTALDNNSKTRAQVYREISERPEVANKYLHESQVVSAYYGFFTRNPDGAYLNYLDRLDRGEINLGDLANAFINASEYRQRFGP